MTDPSIHWSFGLQSELPVLRHLWKQELSSDLTKLHHSVHTGRCRKRRMLSTLLPGLPLLHCCAYQVPKVILRQVVSSLAFTS